MDSQFSENAAESLGGPTFHLPPSFKATYQHGSNSKVVHVRSLSRGGICIEDNVQLEVGTQLQLVLEIKDRKMQAQGEVAWHNQENDKSIYGIKFTFLSSEVQEWFNTFVMDWAAEHLAENLDFSSLTAPAQTERRMFARLKIPLRVEVGFHPDTMMLQTQIFDISEGGLCLLSNFDLKKDQEIFLKLWLNKDEPIALTGVIKYCAKKIFEKRRVNFHGVEFYKDEAVKEVARFIDAKRMEFDLVEMTLDEIISQNDFPQLP